VAVAEASVADLRSRRQDKWKKVNEKFMREREAERLAKRGTMAVALDAMVERMAADRGLALRGNGRGVARPTEMPDRERGKSGAKKRARMAGNARVPMAEEVTGSEAPDTAPLPPPTEPAAPTERVGSRAARVLANAEDDVSVLKGIGRARAEKLRAAGAGSVGALARLSEEAARDLVVTHRMPLKSLLVSMEEARRIISGIVISERSLSSESQF
jgi:predicted flap endonuclease-1-like 5' DNA nuclease